MKDLGQEAREFVESHRRDKALSPGDRARMKQKLMLRVSTLGATTVVAGTAAGMSLASKVLLVALGVSGVVGAGSFSVWALRSRAPLATTVHTSSSRVVEPGAGATRVTAQPGLVPAPRPTAPSVGSRQAPRGNAIARVTASTVARSRPDPAPERAAPREARAGSGTASEAEGTPTGVLGQATPAGAGPADQPKSTSKPAPVAVPENPNTAMLVAPRDPEPELRVVREAREDLRAGRPARAYRRLEDFANQGGAGMLTQERRALSAIALCQAQPGPDAQARAAEFLWRSPESPLATRVRSVCERTVSR